jgi:hypothetical protein
MAVVAWENEVQSAEEIYAGSPMIGMSLPELLQMMGMTEELTALEEARNVFFGLLETATTEEVETAKKAYFQQLDGVCATLYEMMSNMGM